MSGVKKHRLKKQWVGGVKKHRLSKQRKNEFLALIH